MRLFEEGVRSWLVLGGLLATLWAAPGPAGATGAAGFRVPDQSREAPFVIEIQRTFADATKAELIRRAELAEVRETPIVPEETDPPRRVVRAAVGGSLWCTTPFDGVNSACAVTSDALAYYVSVIESFGRSEWQLTHGVVMLSAALRYEAKVEHHAEVEIEGHVFQDVDVVEMSLSWRQYCGSLCAMGFQKQRAVVFDADGRLVAVFFDGAPSVMVS
jgi:hypothetical protein